MSGGSGYSAAGASGSAGADAGAAGVNNEGGGDRWPCVDEKPLLVDGKPTGFSSCVDGSTRRREVMDCPVPLPDPAACASSTSPNQCTSHADCKYPPYSVCDPDADCTCTRGCVRDSDCHPSELCLCGETRNWCVPATCRSDSDCNKGDCIATGFAAPCGSPNTFGCQRTSDLCAGSGDCHEPGVGCYFTGEQRFCGSSEVCPIGRPLLVEAGLRHASLVATAGWG